MVMRPYPVGLDWAVYLSADSFSATVLQHEIMSVRWSARHGGRFLYTVRRTKKRAVGSKTFDDVESDSDSDSDSDILYLSHEQITKAVDRRR